MQLLLWILSTLLGVSRALPVNEVHELHGQKLVDHVNGLKNVSWTAELHPRFASMSAKQLSALMGTRPRHENPRKHLFKLTTSIIGDPADIPESFDARDKWPKCRKVINTIADQSACGSCWAVSAASVMSDRVCIATKGRVKTPVSANDLMSCCSFCGYGCDGGFPDEAFHQWYYNGVVSGSGFTVDKGCSPYPFPECEHHNNATRYSPCPKDLYETPKCTSTCQASYKKRAYKNDKLYGTSPVYLSKNMQAIQKEIMTNGPVVLAFSVYDDFLTYKSGVYKRVGGGMLGGHAVRVIGWGVENDIPYWLIANSWNSDWGDNGMVKFIRGVNDCGIEDEGTAGNYKTSSN